MATLNGQSIKDTYQGLIKTNDESALDPTVAKKLQDGLGNNTTISLSQDRAEFDGIIDLSAAAVVGGLFQMDVPNQIIKTRGVSTNTQTINLSPTDNSVFTQNPLAIGIGFDGAIFDQESIFIGRFGTANYRSTVVGFNSYSGSPESGIFGVGNGINDQGTGLDSGNYIMGSYNTFPENAGITNTHVIGNNVTADESNVVMTNKPFKGTGYKTAGFGEVIDNNGNWTGQPIGGAAGLENGSGSGSLQSAAFLTNGPANASGTDSIAIGSNTQAQFAAVSVGRGSNAGGTASVAIGNSANVSTQQSIGISGETCTVTAQRSIGIGRQAYVDNINSIAIGNFARVTGARSMSFASSGIDTNENAAENALMMVPGSYGCTIDGSAANSIVLGAASTQKQRATIAGVNGVAIGYDTIVNASNAVALGAGVTAFIADTASVKELETQTVGGGIIMYSPNGTGYKLTVSDAGAPVFTAI